MEIPLDTARRMLWASTIVSVGKEDDETVPDVPLLLTGGDELVDHDLCAIGEVTELSLPNDEGVRTGLSVTIFESEDGILRKQ